MAIKVSLTAEQSGIGTPIPEAYARIVAFQYSAQEGKLLFAVEYFWNEEARKSNLRAIGGQTFQIETFDFSAEIGIKKALYSYLKTLPAFEGATDA